MRNARRWAGALALGAVVAGVAGLAAWLRPAADAGVPTASTVPAAARLPAAPSQAMQGARPAPAPAAPAVDAPPLGVQVERLLATRDPHDAYKAYLLVADCATFNRDQDRIIFDQHELKHGKPDSLPGFRGMTEDEKRHDAKLCGGMTERERQNRLDYLAIAARAGVPGAAVAFADEGPFGDRSALKTRPDDPLVKEWKATARAQLQRAADSGTDLAALHVWATANQGGTDLVDKDPVLAYRYLIALGLVQADLVGADSPLARLFAAGSETMGAVGAALTPEQRAAELAAAQAIAARARDARKAGRGG